MFIDIHTHTRRIPGFPRYGKQAYATPEQLIERFDAVEIERGVLLPGVSPEAAYAPQTNEDILEVCQIFPGRFIPFCNVDPRALQNSVDAPLNEILQYYKDKGCKGIGEVTANLAFLDPKMLNLFKHVEAVGLPLTFHIAHRFDNIYGIYDDPGLPQLEQVLQMFPKLEFFAHSQTFWAEIAPLDTIASRGGYPTGPVTTEGTVPKLFRKYQNLYGDLSAGSGCNALKRDPEYTVKFLNEFQDRLFFGTDICAPDTPTPLVDFMLELREQKKISEKVFQKVARENAIRVLGLD